MNQLKLFIELARLKKPIGYMLLFWPCAWGLTLVYDFDGEKVTYIYYILLFLLGAILMRSAGCIVNDIVDRKFDKKVFRTKERPIASGKVSVTTGLIYSLILCLIAFFVLIQFNKLTIILALGSMPFAFIYPFMKRYTHWPQLFLGITFNYGIILGWTSFAYELNILPFIVYLGAIFWTLGYDTIYGLQDIKDDEIIGIKSTSIKFKSNPKKFIGICYFIFFSSILIINLIMKFSVISYFFILILGFHLFFLQIKRLESENPINCLKLFKSNNMIGLIILIIFLIGKINF
jgi:4-hydroxybenzoate polyprenyltransferase